MSNELMCPCCGSSKHWTDGGNFKICHACGCEWNEDRRRSTAPAIPVQRLELHHHGALERAITRLDAEAEKLSSQGDYDCMFPEGDAKSLREILATLPAPPTVPAIPVSDPSELEMHRADYQACRDAGFESQSELLSAYQTLLTKHRSASQPTPETKGK